jgi:ribosomal-protein-alanine N-acetyltransferase
MTVNQVTPAAGKISIRPAKPKDAYRMWEIDQACFEPGIAYSMEIFYYHLLITRDPSFVAIDEGQIIGFVLTSKTGRTGGLLVTIDILDGWRRRGLGARLMALAENAQRRRGCLSIQLQVAVENRPAIEFYEKLGYQKKKFLRGYYSPGKNGYLFSKAING